MRGRLAGKFVPELKVSKEVESKKKNPKFFSFRKKDKDKSKGDDSDDSAEPDVPPPPPQFPVVVAHSSSSSTVKNSPSTPANGVDKPSATSTSTSLMASSKTPSPEVLGADPSATYESVSVYSAATAVSKVLTAAQIAEYSKENIIHTFLGIKVTFGHMVAKKPKEQAKHPGYTTAIRILPYTEVQYSQKAMIDIDAYLRTVSVGGSGPYHISVTKAFDGYRALHKRLESFSIYCHDAKGIPTNGAVIIEASFPRTFKRSSLGLGLSDSQLRTRTAELNRYMGALMTKYHLYPREAQEVINNFVLLDDDNPAEPHSKLLLSM